MRTTYFYALAVMMIPLDDSAVLGGGFAAHIQYN